MRCGQAGRRPGETGARGDVSLTDALRESWGEAHSGECACGVGGRRAGREGLQVVEDRGPGAGVVNVSCASEGRKPERVWVPIEFERGAGPGAGAARCENPRRKHRGALRSRVGGGR